MKEKVSASTVDFFKCRFMYEDLIAPPELMLVNKYNKIEIKFHTILTSKMYCSFYEVKEF